MKYLFILFLVGCSAVPVDKKLERFALIDGDFPNVELCVMDYPEGFFHCQKVKSKEKTSKSINQSDTYLMMSQRDFLKVREYLYKRFKEERNGSNF